MKRSIIFAMVLVVLLGAVIAGDSWATNLGMWFANVGDATGAPITSINVAPGSAFSVAVWYQSSDFWAHNAVELLVSYDQSTARGTSAVPTINNITGTAPAATSFSSVWPVVLANNIGGANGTGLRPYGVHVAVGTALGTSTSAITSQQICNITLTNAMAAGGSQNLVIWNDSSFTSGWTSFIINGLSELLDPIAPTLTVNSTNPLTLSAISDAKKIADTLPVSCAGTVTASFSGYFYIESPDRSCGIRVAKDSYTAGLTNTATVSGVMGTLASGEREVVASNVTETPGAAVSTLAMANKSMGTLNVGLLVTTTGKVTNSSSGSFNLDDGSGIAPTAMLFSGDPPANSTYVSVTGISSSQMVGSVVQPVILVTHWVTYAGL